MQVFGLFLASFAMYLFLSAAAFFGLIFALTYGFDALMILVALVVTFISAIIVLGVIILERKP